MTEERKEILKMLADKVITVDEAERLLKALEGSAKKGRNVTDGIASSVEGILEAVGEALSEIGPAVKNAAGDMLSGAQVYWIGPSDLNEDKLEDVALEDGRFSLAEADHLIIINDRTGGPGGGDLTIRGTDGTDCTVGEGAHNVRVGRDGSKFAVYWAGGHLELDIPQSMANVTAMTRSGRIGLRGIEGKVNCSTFGGNVDLEDLSGGFKAKTMGGDVDVRLGARWKGEGRATTTGGNIRIAFPDDVSAKVKAATMGGNLKLDKGLGTVVEGRSFPMNRVTLKVGQDSFSAMKLKSMGGNIELRKA